MDASKWCLVLLLVCSICCVAGMKRLKTGTRRVGGTAPKPVGPRRVAGGAIVAGPKPVTPRRVAGGAGVAGTKPVTPRRVAGTKPVTPRRVGATAGKGLASRRAAVTKGCQLSLKTDFGIPSPVFLKQPTNQFLTPSASGIVSFAKAETMQVACPGGLVKVGDTVTTHEVLNAECVGGKKFKADGKTVDFTKIVCNKNPKFSSENTGQGCHVNSHTYKVGYKVAGTFHPLYEACFDADRVRTHYVTSRLTPSAVLTQCGTYRPEFKDDGPFGKLDMNSLYLQTEQKKRLDAILGSNMGDKYITDNQYLTRGHHAACEDFSLGAEKRASFHYVNTSPQWMRGNRGHWSALEGSLRKRVQKLGVAVTVYTGTYKVLTLANATGSEIEIYLTEDNTRGPIVPVPLYFYKVVYDPIAKKATAFITINSTYYDKAKLQSLEFCPNLCKKNSKSVFSWLKWENTNEKHSFCCAYDEFKKEIDYLPNIQVLRLFS